MTNTKRWLDELPHGSHERELLLVGKAARPAEGSIDANWKALCTALGTTAAISGTFATSAAASAAATSASTSAKVGASLVASKAVGTALSVVAAKSLAVGVGIGLAIMGAAAAVERASEHSASPAAVERSGAETAHRPPSHAPPTPLAAQPVSPRDVPAASPSNSASSFSRPHDVAQGPLLNSVGTPAALPAPTATSVDEKAASLARQARELAELKRLIDSGATTEALRRLNENFNTRTASVLSEERDALHVQALARARRHDEARALARQFLVHYPRSPYFETMRQLLNEK